MTRRPLIITGMARSGTTMLQQLCDSHPQMRVTKEFGNYAWIGESYPSYAAKTCNRIRVINGRWRILGPPERLPTKLSEEVRIRSQNHLANVRAAGIHLLRLARMRPGRVTLPALVDEAAERAPQARIVGDKLPLYAFMLDRLVQQTGLLRLMIYRDCRDVTSSFLRRVRTDWKRQKWTRNADTAQKIARRWVRAIENMELHAASVWVVRYEDLVRDPRDCISDLATWLDVEPSGFDAQMVFDSSVGKYKQGLTPQEHDTVLEIAGPAMTRLGYSLD